MKKLMFMACVFVVLNVDAATMPELLVQNIKENSDSYICHHSDLNGKEFEEIVVCVEGKNLRSIELIDLWISNYNVGKSTKKEHEFIVKKAESLVPDSTYVLSVKMLDSKDPETSMIYMTAFCSKCIDIESATQLDDQSSYVFDNLKVFSSLD